MYASQKNIEDASTNLLTNTLRQLLCAGQLLLPFFGKCVKQEDLGERGYPVLSWLLSLSSSSFFTELPYGSVRICSLANRCVG
jgi:hypothetical protein